MLGVPNEVKKALFIINKFSGAGYKAALEGRILTAMQAYDATCVLEYTRARGHATTLAEQAIKDGFDCIVAVGGDGTLNEVAQALVGTHVKMGIIPKGSGNGLARHLGIPLSVTAATHTVFQGSSLLMDTFTVNNKLSLNVSGIGFDGKVANAFGKIGGRGLHNYVRLTLQEYARFKPFEATIQYDGTTITRNSFIIAVANSSQYGNNARIAPQASVCDQQIQLNIVSKVPIYRLDWAIKLFSGQIDQSAYCEIHDAKEVRIELSAPMDYHVDGEPCGEAAGFHIKVQPASLHVIVPSTTHSL